MRGRNKIYRWLFALWILIGCVSAADVYAQTTLPAAWSTTPTLSTDNQPNYQFHSTSAYTPMVNTTVYSPGCSSPSSGPSRMRRSWDDEPDDDSAIGQMDTPIGEPWVLLLMVLTFLIGKIVRFGCKNAQKE